MKNPKDLTLKIQNSLTSKRQASGAAHTYVQAPVVKVPPKVPIASALKKKELRQMAAVAKEWNPAASQTAACSSHLEAKACLETDLAPERVKRWKNPAAMVRKLQRSANSSAKLPKKISVVSEESTSQQEKMQEELWQDMMKNQPERHFRLDRITNFFT